MGIRLYHQVGFRENWNLESLKEDGCGDGLILSPVHQPREKVEVLEEEVRQHCLFDPQYYLPNSPKAKLASYAFFPEQLTGGFSTKDFVLVAMESAAQCVDFQVEQNFEAIVIPARYIDQMLPKYFEKQEDYTVHPFLKAIQNAKIQKPVYLTLPITSAMLMDSDFRTQLLNWVTGFPEVSGVYLLVGDDRTSKQIRSEDLIFSYLSFAQELINAGLQPLLGHLNTESIVLSVVDGAALTFGAYENTRIFSIDKFIESEEERRAPKPRIYLPPLLNWIQYDQALRIRTDDSELWNEIYVPTPHSERVLQRSLEPHFTQPDLYRHHFVCMHDQLERLSKLSVQKRFETVRGAIRRAIELHARIEDMRMDLDFHGRGDHLQPWLDGLNHFYRKFLKT